MVKGSSSGEIRQRWKITNAQQSTSYFVQIYHFGLIELLLNSIRLLSEQ
jgi:hypothetical protein